MSELEDSIKNVTADELSSLCSGTGRDFSEIETLLDSMATVFLDLSSVAIDAIELLACEGILPIYVSLYSSTFYMKHYFSTHMHSFFALYRRLRSGTERASIL